VITLDKAWIYLSNSNNVHVNYYHPKGETNISNWVRMCKESFLKGFMVVTGYCHKGKFPFLKKSSKAKINSDYYLKNVLELLYRNHIPALYDQKATKVFAYRDKIASPNSKTTLALMTKIEIEKGIKPIPYSCIPVKSPDASPKDFCGFGCLKRALKNRHSSTLEGLWKVCCEDWDIIP
jgi:hypothetical protein